MKDLCALFRSAPEAFCRACGDDPCVCDAPNAARERRLRRELRDETALAFAEARVRTAAWLARNGLKLG